jgi:hypothetical protein
MATEKANVASLNTQLSAEKANVASLESELNTARPT